MIRKGMTPDQASGYLSKNCGLIGLSGYSSNLGEIIEAAEQGNKACELAFKVYVNRLRSYIGAYLYEMNGADALIFTDDGGVRFAKMREAACRDSDFLGMKLDTEKNDAYDMLSAACLSTADSRVQIWVIPTDEERTIYNELVLRSGM
jgi:acetate kinase